MPAVARITKTTGRSIARPLKALIPMIQGELQLGNEAGREHYQRVGEMLIEARGQMTTARWSRWLSKNFELSKTTADRYMRWARKAGASPDGTPWNSINDMEGTRERRQEERTSDQQKEFRRVLRDLARDAYLKERQTIEAEVGLHRELALELVEIGFRALATRLHPDRGGSHSAMTRLNRVRGELNAIAKTRRYDL